MAYKQKLTFGIIIGTRNIFNFQLAQEGRRKILAELEKMGFEVVILPAEATPTGAVETLQDARKCAELFSQNRNITDGILVTLPNFGDELGVVNALKYAELNVPILVHAEDDDNDKVDVKSRRDSFCGKLSVCNNLYQYGIPFTDTTFHTCKVDSDIFRKDIQRFAAICRVVVGLKHARIGAIGARPAAFQTMRASEKLLQESGITVVPVDLSEIIGEAQRVDDQAGVLKTKIGEIKEYGKIPTYIHESKITLQAKLGVAIEKWIAENEIDAAGVQCWSSVQNNYGCATCISMSMLGEKMIPCACEVDIAGVISMYMLALASGRPSAILDWNNNFGDDRNMCVCTHCSNYPKSFFENEVEISNLDVLGTTLGQANCFGAVKGKVKAGPMTFFRISTDDTLGMIKSYLGEGEFTDDAYGMDGGIAVTRVQNLQTLLKYLCKNGFEHHVAMVRGNVSGILAEAIDSYLGWDLYLHE
ncbi:fucose isomerase [candidate division KSB1 bacterium RBG_16_48_16]|nr:MAG: fucose isomerase [candidate division KSB1 bacterium RBG_16_48_16]